MKPVGKNKWGFRKGIAGKVLRKTSTTIYGNMAETYNSLDSIWLTFKKVDPWSQLTAHTLLYKRRENGDLFIEEYC